LIIGTQQIVTPGDGGFQRLMAQGGGSAATDKQLETVVETLDQLLEAEGPKSHGRKLDCEGDTVESPRQLDHGCLVVQGYLEGGARFPCALDE
jgi:hypothetical protein